MYDWEWTFTDYKVTRDTPNEIRAELAKHLSILKDTKSVVIPFANTLHQPLDVTKLIPIIGGGTAIDAVIAHINENKNKFDLFVIVTDCDTEVNTDLIDDNKMVIVVTNQPEKIVGKARPNLKVIGVERF